MSCKVARSSAQDCGDKQISVTADRRVRVISLLLSMLGFAVMAGLAEVDARPSASAPGMFVGIGSQQLHLHCTGDGGPAVILESGLGGYSLDWSRVQPLVARFTRVCSYDRAGYGWSEPAKAPRTARTLAAELHRLLVYGSVPPPYVLVGHSFGGLVVRLFASLHPNDTAGIVLVDSTHEEQFERFARAGVENTFLPTGKTFFIFNRQRIPHGLPESIRPVARTLASRSSAVHSLYSELRFMLRSTHQVRASGPIPKVPVVVIARKSDDRRASPDSDRIEELWLEMQMELANRNGLGVLILADTKDHYIHLSQPQLVVDGIRSIIQSEGGSR